MLPYWLLLGFAALPAFETNDRRTPVRAGFLALVLAFAMIVLIGFRYKVGADWYAYVRMYRQIAVLDLGDALTITDPAYALLNYIAAHTGVGLVTVNLLCGLIFTVGLFRFAFSLPNPWLALTTSIPYLVIVVAMGYARQGVALGCMMLSLTALSRKSFAQSVGWLIVAASFHKTAVLVIPLLALAYARHRALTTTAAAILLPVMFYLLIAGQFDTLFMTYVEHSYGSQGAIIRVLMAALPGSIYIVFRKRFELDESVARLYLYMSIVAIALIPVVLATSNTTIVDRFALYLLPLQMLVASWLPILAGQQQRRNASVVVSLLAYAAVVQFVWLNYASHAQDWIPYQFYPVGSEIDAV